MKDLTANGHRIDLLGSETIDDVEHYVLKLTLSDGFENLLLINAERGLVTRSHNRRALHDDVDDEEKVIESRMSNFRRTGDIVHPFNVVEVDLMSGETMVRITLQSLDLNKDLPEGSFRDLVGFVPEL